MDIGRITRLAMVGSILLAVSCSEDSVGPGGDGGNTASWELGEETSFTITGQYSQSVVDPVSGLEFVFPEGGEGELSISAIISGPESPTAGSGFAVEFTGVAPIELRVDREDTEEIMLVAYGSAEGCYDDALAANERWLAVPATDTTDGVTTFLLDVTTDDLALHKPGSRTFKYHWMSRISQTSTDADKMRAMRWQSADFVTQFVDELSTTHQSRVQSEVTSRLKVRYQWDGLYYSGFWRRSLGPHGRDVVPTLHFTVNASASSVAHETGHYLVHALVGDDVQSTLEGQGNILYDHEIGDDNQRAKLLEEYAYVLEYYFTNSVASYNPEHPYTLWGGLQMSPSAQDIPGREGFGLLMLSGLTRTGTQVQSLVNPSINLPIPEIARPFSDVFDIIAMGATHVPGLLSNITTTLTPEENKKYQVIMERSGWQYRITGTLVDKDNQPIPDVLVSNVLTAGGTRYIGGVTYIPTGTNGQFTLTGEVFPGTSTLQCVKGSDTTYVDITVDWTKPTNQQVNVGTLTVDFENILAQLQVTDRVMVSVQGEHYSNRGEMTDETIFKPNRLYDVTWNGTAFAAVDSGGGNSYSYERRISGTVSANGRTILSAEYTYKWRENNIVPQAGIVRSEVDTRISITNVNFIGESYSYLLFQLDGSSVGSHVSLSYRRLVEWEDEEFGTEITEYTHTNWSSATTTPLISVYF